MSHSTDTASTGPLLWSTAREILAIEPESGALRWRLDLTSRPVRLFRVGSRLLVAHETGVICVDVDSGRQVGSVSLGFRCAAGIARGGQLYLAGPEGAACLAEDGSIVWVAKQTYAGGLSMASNLVCTTADGRELWSTPASASQRYNNPGLVLDEQVVQPDLDRT